MRSIKKFGTAVAAVLSLAAMVGASSASAVSWSPLGTNSGPASGVLTLTTNRGATVRCTFASHALAPSATPTVASTTNAAGTPAAPTWSSCSNSISSFLSTSVTSSSAWTLTAVSTTSVNVGNGNAVINIGGGICTITATGVSVTGNAWRNPGTSSSLTANSAVSFPIRESGICDGGTTARMSGTVTISSGVLPSIV